ncbi:MAG: glycoside hydrolase domain-containing protein [Chryseosolibacter sp.]
MFKFSKIIIFFIFLAACGKPGAENKGERWKLSILPSSVRLDPVSNEIIEDRFKGVEGSKSREGSLLDKNWIYDGDSVFLHGARGEYISFQLALTNHTDSMLTDMRIEMSQFASNSTQFKISPEMFLEWSVEVKSPSTGYPKATLGTGWYPDALIPFNRIQSDSSKVRSRWVYPLTLPDFNNRIDGQRSQIFWIDQYIPFDREDAKPGKYTSTLTVTIGGVTQKIPVSLRVWDFAIPNENQFKASLQHEGFLSGANEKQELEVYQLFKRNRVSLMDPTYQPDLQMSKNGGVDIQWEAFDKRLKKYLTGEAFTSSYGYEYGPGVGEPIETFALPFDVYGKHGTAGWPDIGKPDVERNPENQARYVSTIQKVRDHLKGMIDPKKTDLTVYLNGLDESYFQEAWDRMVFYGDVFKKHYPEAQFRVDGAYSEEAMDVIGKSINAWASHTINYNIEQVSKHQKNGIKDWLYGPMLYESKVNSWVGSSTFIDLPLVNDRAISWSCWKYRTYSWISWGIGAGWESGWYDPESWKDFYKEASEADAEFTYRKFNGNGSLVYKPGVVPNVNVVCPSIRLKTMRTGVQDYEYMRLLTTLDGNSARADKIVNEIINRPFGDNAIGKLDVWNFDAAKWDERRIALGEMIHEKMSGRE